MGCILLRGFLTVLPLLDAEGRDVGMVQHRQNVQPMSPLKQQDVAKVNGGRANHHVSLSHIGTWKIPFEPPSPNSSSCLVWLRSSLVWLALTQMHPRHRLGITTDQGPFPRVWEYFSEGEESLIGWIQSIMVCLPVGSQSPSTWEETKA